jgi:hypothetical protein
MRRTGAFDRPASGNNAIERFKTIVALGAGGLLGITIGLSICTTVLS